MKFTVKVLLIVLAVMIFATGVAWAKSFPPTQRSTTGAIATCKGLTATKVIHDDTAYLTCDLRDTLADHYSVYIAWHIDGYRDVKLYNKRGASSVTHFESGQYNPDGSIGHIYWKVCRDRPLLPDNCSSLVTLVNR